MDINKPMMDTTIINSTIVKPPSPPVFIRILGHFYCRQPRPTNRGADFVNSSFGHRNTCDRVEAVFSKPGAAPRTDGISRSSFDCQARAERDRCDVQDPCNRLMIFWKHVCLRSSWRQKKFHPQRKSDAAISARSR